MLISIRSRLNVFTPRVVLVRYDAKLHLTYAPVGGHCLYVLAQLAGACARVPSVYASLRKERCGEEHASARAACSLWYVRRSKGVYLEKASRGRG